MLVKSKVKYIQSLSQKKLRDEEGVFIAEGPKIINELLSAPNVQVKELFALKEWKESVIGFPEHFSEENITEVDYKTLERISGLDTPNQVLGIFNKPVFDSGITVSNKVSLMLDSIQNPGNMGTIIRCADWFGVQQIICNGECADIFNQKVIQSTMGSIARVRVIHAELDSFIENHPVPLYAAAMSGTSIYELKPIQEGIILVGNESRGVPESLLNLATHRITIPRKGKAESLNAALATGIILSHVVR